MCGVGMNVTDSFPIKLGNSENAARKETVMADDINSKADFLSLFFALIVIGEIIFIRACFERISGVMNTIYGSFFEIFPIRSSVREETSRADGFLQFMSVKSGGGKMKNLRIKIARTAEIWLRSISLW